MSFVVVVNWTLIQVAVAVLLDNFVTVTAQEKAEVLPRLRVPLRPTSPHTHKHTHKVNTHTHSTHTHNDKWREEADECVGGGWG
jgi:hypothetical protein